MSDKSAYVLVRVPKSGSTSLQRMVASVLPDAQVFETPETARTISSGVTFYESLRNRRRRWRFFKREHGVSTEPRFWAAINAKAQDGDVVAGHICYGEPALPDFDLNYITLLRDPRERILSNYNYDRVGFKKRPGWRRAYSAGQMKASGKTFLDYLTYLADADRRAIQPAVMYVTGETAPADAFGFLRDRYFHFGVVERMDLFAQDLSDKLGRPVEAEWTNKTPRRRHATLSGDEARMIEKIFPLDLELYEKARDAVLAGRPD